MIVYDNQERLVRRTRVNRAFCFTLALYAFTIAGLIWVTFWSCGKY